MDFLKILRSFEDLIFEAATWLLLYPRTLWRILTRPLATMAYSDREQAEREEEHRYDDALSPPLVLLFTVVLVDLVGLALHVPAPAQTSEMTKALVGSQQNLIMFRSLVFSLVPLVAAATLLNRQRIPLSREALRAPFYAQCYLAAPCAIFISIGGDIFRRSDIDNLWGAALMVLGAGWFLVTQTRWFAARLSTNLARAALLTVAALLLAFALLPGDRAADAR